MNEYVVLLQRNRNYRFLWLGSVISQFGDWFNLLASAELIARLTSSGVAISSLFLARFLPLFLFSPLAGVLADRFNRRHMMILADLLRAGVVSGFLLIRSPQQVWLLYTLTVLQFALSALFTPARSAVLANIVPREELVAANALDSLTWSTMLALGAFMGGIVAAVLGGKMAFVMDATTFVFSALLVSRIVTPTNLVSVSSQREWKRGWLSFIEGFRYLLGAPFLLGISLAKATGSLVWGGINVLELAFANEVFPWTHPFLARVLATKSSSTATLGVIYMMSGLGTGLGPLLLRRWLGDAYNRLLWGIMAGFVLLAGGILGLSAAPNLAIFSLATLVRTVGSGVIWVFSAALLQMLVPDRLRGRVFAFEFAALTLTQSVSTLGAGFLLDRYELGVRGVTAVIGLLGLGVGVLWLAFLLSYVAHVKDRQEIERAL